MTLIQLGYHFELQIVVAEKNLCPGLFTAFHSLTLRSIYFVNLVIQMTDQPISKYQNY